MQKESLVQVYVQEGKDFQSVRETFSGELKLFNYCYYT